MKILLLLLAALVILPDTGAQTNCNAKNIYGLWHVSGSVRTDSYVHPPDNVNIDSLKSAFPNYPKGAYTRSFFADGTFRIKTPVDDNRKGKFELNENNCVLKLSSRKRDPMIIVHLDDSCMILWHNNPKTAYLTVYRK